MRFYRYHGRAEAGRQLAPLVRKFITDPATSVVISVPRGGVAVGAALAEALGFPHDIVITRKIAEENDPEWALGAITESGEPLWDPALTASADPAYLRIAVLQQIKEARRRLRVFRRRLKPRDVKGKTVVLTDDGVARGWTLLAAVRTLRSEGVERIIVAVPVCSREGLYLLSKEADTVVTGYVPERFRYVGAYYRRFTQVSDDRVKALLRR